MPPTFLFRLGLSLVLIATAAFFAGAWLDSNLREAYFASVDSSGYREVVGLTRLFCLFLGGTGLALFAVAARHFVRWKSDRAPVLRMFPDMAVRNVMPPVKHAPLQVIHELPHWGLSCGAVVWILIMMFMMFGPLPSTGLPVTWKKRDMAVREQSPWPDSLETHIRAPARFFVNGEEVHRNELHLKLTEQLGHRADWTVYFEADPYTDYGDTVYAIDVIQGCGARLIWVTPKMREQWQHSNESPSKN